MSITMFTVNGEFWQSGLIGNRVLMALAHLNLQMKKKNLAIFFIWTDVATA